MFLRAGPNIPRIQLGNLDGQPMLFRDCEVKLKEQLQLAERLSKHFNPLADALDIAEIDLEELRDSLQSEADRRVSIWVSRARVKMLSLFGTSEEMHAALDQGLRLYRAEIR